MRRLKILLIKILVMSIIQIVINFILVRFDISNWIVITINIIPPLIVGSAILYEIDREEKLYKTEFIDRRELK